MAEEGEISDVAACGLNAMISGSKTTLKIRNHTQEKGLLSC